MFVVNPDGKETGSDHETVDAPTNISREGKLPRFAILELLREVRVPVGFARIAPRYRMGAQCLSRCAELTRLHR